MLVSGGGVDGVVVDGVVLVSGVVPVVEGEVLVPVLPVVLVPLVSDVVPGGGVAAVSLRLQPPSRAASMAAASANLDTFEMDFIVAPYSRQSRLRKLDFDGRSQFGVFLNEQHFVQGLQ